MVSAPRSPNRRLLSLVVPVFNEAEVLPAFYERDESGLPRRWIAKLRSSMARLAPRFSSVRMLQEYVERAYLPGAAAYQRRPRQMGSPRLMSSASVSTSATPVTTTLQPRWVSGSMASAS